MVWLALANPLAVWAAQCPSLPTHERVQIAEVHDGDTLRLVDGRRLRLLAVNAPELARDDKPEQPLARASRDAVEAFIAETEFVHLSYESRRADRYGRVLAHVTLPSGRNLESYLVGAGLAFPLAVPPDLRWAECLQSQAEAARDAGLGVWRQAYWQPLPATQLDQARAEFRQVCGRVSKVDRAGDLFIELEGALVLRVARDDWPAFADAAVAIDKPQQLLGRNVTAQGWLVDRRQRRELLARGYQPWLLQVRTPYAWRWDEPCAMLDAPEAGER